MNEIFEIEYTGCDAQGNPINGTQRYPAYSCGHCSNTVVINPRRSRPRVTCKKCGRWICESSELCQVDCTPIYALAQDHAWNEENQWTRLVPAIMSGAQSMDEALKKGLIKE